MAGSVHGSARASRIFYDFIDLGICQMAVGFLEGFGKVGKRGPIVGSPEVLLDQPLYILLGSQPVSLGPAAKGCKFRFRELREFQGGNWHRSVTILSTRIVRERPVDEQTPVDSYEPCKMQEGRKPVLNIPLLAPACSEGCIARLPKPADGYVRLRAIAAYRR